jgi:3-dehydrosphinganine reductase
MDRKLGITLVTITATVLTVTANPMVFTNFYEYLIDNCKRYLIWNFDFIARVGEKCATAIKSLPADTISPVTCLSDSSQLIFILFLELLILVFILAIGFYCIYLLFSNKLSYNPKGKHVLVTGGSSGIGFSIALEYVMKGANVTILARDELKLKEKQGILQATAIQAGYNTKVMIASVDACSGVKAIEKAIEKSVASIGSVDILVNCAGTSIASDFSSLPEVEFEKMLKINYLGSVYTTKAVVDKMMFKNEGRIIFVASQVAQVAIHGYTAYAGSKWALRGFAEALQMELKPYNIYVSVAYPPDTDTPGYKIEMESKPLLTKLLSESGSVFSPEIVAKDIIHMSSVGYFGITTGFDGWLLKQLHPGFTPINNMHEIIQQILFSPLARFISLFYILNWDALCMKHKKNVSTETKSVKINKKKN